MLTEPAYTLRVIWACMRKDIKSAVTERFYTIVSLFVPMNILIPLSLCVLSRGQAATAVVMKDTGPYAQRFCDAMSHAHSSRLQKTTHDNARHPFCAGKT